MYDMLFEWIVRSRRSEQKTEGEGVRMSRRRDRMIEALCTWKDKPARISYRHNSKKAKTSRTRLTGAYKTRASALALPQQHMRQLIASETVDVIGPFREAADAVAKK